MGSKEKKTKLKQALVVEIVVGSEGGNNETEFKSKRLSCFFLS